jgi:5-methylcytosine-specific restriction endonuclease McrA
MLSFLKNNMPKGRKGFQKGNRLGSRIKTPQEIEKLRMANLGKIVSDKTREKLRYTKTKEHNEKISKTLKGRKVSDESLLKRRKHYLEFGSSLSGRKISDEVRRKISQTLKGNISWNKGKECPQFRGVNHPNWKGGTSFEPYSVDWTKTLKVSIRERDKYICQLCFEQQGDIAHDVHHIDYNKENCNPSNLITLCHKCHMKTNFNRDYWINFFIKK